MNKSTASDFVDFFTKRFDIIETVVFFGGEPLMNPDIIELICKKFKSYYDLGEIKSMPTYGIITNGTILNNRILELIKNYINFITVSLDGWKEINDLNRKFPDGRGSYDKISDFIKTVLKKTNSNVRFEATITKEHKQLEITDASISDYIYKEFGIKGSIVPDIFFDFEDPININNLERTLEVSTLIPNNDIIYLDEGLSNVLSAITNNLFNEMCPVGKNIVSVSTDGVIYPCHMNNGKEHLSLGSIYSNNIFDNRNFYYDKYPYLKAIFKENGSCKKCWARRICGGCVIKWFFDLQNDNYKKYPNELLCKKNKKYLENIILKLAVVKSDKEKWNKFVNRLKKNI